MAGISRMTRTWP